MNKDSCSKRIKRALDLKGVRQSELCRITGIPKSAMSQYIKGTFEPRQDRVYLISKALNVSEAWLMGFDVPMEREKHTEIDYSSISGITPLPKTVKRPRLGQIACDEPVMTEEHFDGYDDVPENMACDFTLICHGDSMINARIHDGDIVYIKQQPTVENGQIAAIMIDGETTLKRVYIDGDRLTIMPENPAYKPHVYIGEELNNIRIIGRATGFTSHLD